ncbi:hypothetical protein E2C01_076979 [Portunus trituberculatus]|uniref:Uncharacterized protein n=1 Tax=Portunus trituberculatus TaxID=210409 RepID=A0A5B7IA67_PORTR|nr:hypothetical protein [Portunus trituberculatus]
MMSLSPPIPRHQHSLPPIRLSPSITTINSSRLIATNIYEILNIVPHHLPSLSSPLLSPPIISIVRRPFMSPSHNHPRFPITIHHANTKGREIVKCLVI